jgi:hypothetical protein
MWGINFKSVLLLGSQSLTRKLGGADGIHSNSWAKTSLVLDLDGVQSK